MISKQEKFNALVVTRAQLVQIYGKTTKTIGTWMGHGLPALDESRGRARLFYLPDVIQWRESYVQGSDTLSAQAEKARVDKFRADKLEIELDIAVGKVADVNLVTSMVSGHIAECVARLMSLPGKMAPVAFGAKTIAKAEKLIRTELYECVSELAELEPTDYIQQNKEVVEAAANIKSKRVGRQKQKAKSRGKRGAGEVADK